jgi:glycosyltransferase involved in cell wall biosynthesis
MSKVSIVMPYYNRKNLLKVTLDSYAHFYKGKSDLEIVIVDDGSTPEHRLENFVKAYPLNINLIRIEQKGKVKYINPCYPINVGVRHSTGDIIVLTSPEIFHTTNMFTTSNNFAQLNDQSYLLFSVFCLTTKSLIHQLTHDVMTFDRKLKIIQGIKHVFSHGLGASGRDPFNNVYGSWYTHSVYRHTCLNFLSAITRKLYFSLGGFDERFRHGISYDDEEFKVRLMARIKHLIWVDDALAIHINHEIVPGPKKANSDLIVQVKKQNFVYNGNNNQWGQL